MTEDLEALKRAAAEAAAQLVQDGMAVGLGTGSTVRHLLPAIAARQLRAVRYVATSPATAEQAMALGLAIEPFDTLDRLDLAIDGADQVAADGALVKGGGGAHVREKVVAGAADRFVVIVDATKAVEALVAPVPLELLAFGLRATLAQIAPAAVRDGAALSPDGNVIADYTGPVGDAAPLAARLDGVPGVVGHGLFAAAMVSDVFVGGSGGVQHRTVRSGR
ncbi:MAG TPA: ribose-5-phosphate isomerase RpiA [Baekduia sp.]|uniref:ribose-5-phosphate isomerase RpiA n=1 Tax=Baekduia sp. TaxID=2600305 RepID=UPI002BAB7EAF|nr:ribose-5-phosphate isomerase RpiA [Baekduia sp.]HMJ33682.1 ribose-5-phosphate isomerase RpiA [Baekduia sp.]